MESKNCIEKSKILNEFTKYSNSYSFISTTIHIIFRYFYKPIHLSFNNNDNETKRSHLVLKLLLSYKTFKLFYLFEFNNIKKMTIKPTTIFLKSAKKQMITKYLKTHIFLSSLM